MNCLYKIFIVEDDAVIAGEMARQIEAWGFGTAIVQNFENVVAEFAECDPQLVLMDVSLPFFNGYYWCSEIRKISKVPIIFISSASDNMNIVMAVNMGGDDFIAKPFGMEVLTAKIQALLRRTYNFPAPSRLLECSGAVLNLSDATLSYENEKTELTKNEFRILQLLIENKGHIVSRETIITKLWESDSFVDENTLTVNITRLRRKLESLGLTDFIATKKGIGYMVG